MIQDAKKTSDVVRNSYIVFVSTMENLPWAGSEELWSQTALDLVSRGVPVAASVHNWWPLHEKVENLAEAGVELQLRKYPIWRRARRRLFASDKAPLDLQTISFLAAHSPALVLASGGPASSIGLLEACVAKGIPFATLCQQNSELFWPDDDSAKRYRRVMLAARRCYFVSSANLRLFENQIACSLPNSEVVYNPFNVDINARPPWPTLGETSELRLACVARLDPSSKGQDILLEALAEPVWRKRNWRLVLYGEGPMRNGLEYLVRRLGLQSRVLFGGYVGNVEEIWAQNHVLVMPSRYEGMPLAMVEAMLCARPVVATDVAGHSEIIDEGQTGFLADAPTASSLSKALERLWAMRPALQECGNAAAISIRKYVPSDPVRTFAEKIQGLAEFT